MYKRQGGNGTGKSTTLSLVARQRKPQRGKIFINNIEMKKYNNKSLYAVSYTHLDVYKRQVLLFIY